MDVASFTTFHFPLFTYHRTSRSGGCFDHDHRRTDWFHFGEAEPCLLNQPPVSVQSTFPACQHDHHVKIHQRSQRRFTHFAKQYLDYHDLATSSDRFSAAFQDRDRLVVIPIMENMFEQIKITGGDILEEVRGKSSAPVAQPQLTSRGFSTPDHLG